VIEHSGQSKEGEIYSDLLFSAHVGQDATLPHVFINIVCTLDGRTALEGKASGLGSQADRQVMRTLRSRADAVMIGGGTLRAEKLSLGLDAEDPRPRPLAVILTNTGDIPLGSNLVSDERQRVLVLLSDTTDKGAERSIGNLAEVRRIPAASGAIDLALALKTLKSEYDVGRLLVEGGPTLNNALISSDLADEMFLTLAPMLLGTSTRPTPPTTRGTSTEPRNLRLLSAYVDADELFLRYSLR
jgi:diaminohydroxyphosphoribosylaminopyrimidine deaminase/5-amino-6-(5-phosphoribosylamino)uracil reductase